VEKPLSYIIALLLLLMVLPITVFAATTSIVPLATGSSPSIGGTSSWDGARYAPWKAFDVSTGIEETWYSASVPTPTAPQKVWYDFGSLTRITSFAITSSGGNMPSAPQNFDFQGWDGSAWVTIQSYSNITGWLGSQRREFTIATPQSFSKYAVSITANNGSTSYTSIGYLEMFGNDVVVTPTPTPSVSLVSLVSGGNTLNSKLMVINYDQAKSVDQTKILPYSYSTVESKL
jgi:hypothetical protein